MDAKKLSLALVRPRRPREPVPAPTPDARVTWRDGEVALYLRAPSDPKAPRALLVHGWEADHRDFDAIAAMLAQQGIASVLPDLPAHGRSSGETMMIPEAADAMVAVGAAYGPFDLCVGHSMGAAIALVAMSRGLRIGRAAFLAPPSNYVRQLSLSARAAGAPEPLVAAALDELRRRAPELDGIDSLALARHLTMPGLVVVAGRDRTLSPEDGRTIAGAWPGCRLLELPEATHRSVLEDAAVLLAIRELAALQAPDADIRAAASSP